MRIKLVSKALSYSIDRYVATQKEPIIDVPQEMAIGLVESGSFIALDDNSNSDVNSENAEGMAVTAVPSNTTIDAEEKEELDADIVVGDLIDTIEFDYPDFHLSMDCFWCELESEHVVLNEHEDAKWLSRAQLDSVDWLPADVTLVEKIAKGM